MRRAAGYSTTDEKGYGYGVAELLGGGLPIPNIPGHRAHENAAREKPKAKQQTLRFVKGYPIVEDAVSQPKSNAHHLKAKVVCTLEYLQCIQSVMLCW
jgi:hypothetical protein